MKTEGNFLVATPVERTIDTGEGFTIPEYIRNNMDKWGWGDKIAFECAETGKRYTYNQVLENSRAFAAGLIKLGPEISLQWTDVVAVMLLNVAEFPSVLCGIWEAGLIATPVNPHCLEHEILRQLEATRSKVIITSSKFLPIAKSLLKRSSTIKTIIVLSEEDPEEVLCENCISYSAMLQSDTNNITFFTGSHMTTKNDIALLPFSSGTSGHPKGVMLTHSALLSNIILYSDSQVNHIKKYGEGKNDVQERLLVVVPFFHIYGITYNILVSILQGVHVMTIPQFTQTTFVKKLGEHKPTYLYLVPTVVSLICNSNSIGPGELDQVRFIICGAATTGEVLIRKILKKVKNAVFLEMYGLTEVCGAITMSRFEKIGSIGQLLPEAIGKVVDVTSGATLGEGQWGELCFKSPTVMKGYLNNEQATRDIIDNDGWLHSGDVGYYDHDGCFFSVDRLKELIKVKGFQVAPAELEDLIRSHDKVANVAVIGIPDKISGEVPRAFVVPKDDNEKELTQEEIVDFVHTRVTHYKRLRGGVQFVKEIPIGESGKVLRRALLQTYVTGKAK